MKTGEERLKLGEKVDLTKAKKGPPPIVLMIQPTHYFVIETPEQLKEWESSAFDFFGVKVRGAVGSGTEGCSGGRSDMCDVLE